MESDRQQNSSTTAEARFYGLRCHGCEDYFRTSQKSDCLLILVLSVILEPKIKDNFRGILYIPIAFGSSRT